MKNLFSALFVSVFLLSSCSDEEPGAGGGVPSGKSFTIAVPQVTRSVARSIHVSDNGQHIYLQAFGSASNSVYYSSDGGNTFSLSNLAASGDDIRGVADNGAILRSQNGLILLPGGSENYVSLANHQFILGQTKLFAYSSSNTIKYRGISEFQYQDVAGSFPGTILKAPGVGLAAVTEDGAGNVTVKVLNEQTLNTQTFNFSVNTSTLNNGCNALNRFTRFDLQFNNMIVVRGCTALAVVNMASGQVTYHTYPTDPSPVYTDLRDIPAKVDADGNVYLSYANFTTSQLVNVYKWSGDKFEKLDDYVTVDGAGSVFAVTSNAIFYNSENVEGTVIASMIKKDLSNDQIKQLGSVTEPMQITEAIAADKNTVLFLSNSKLYKYEIGSATLTKVDEVGTVSHINVLSDGRWLAGAYGKIYLSDNEGETWSVQENIFAASGEVYTVNESRIVDGKLMIVGTNSYSYYNQTLGMWTNQYDNEVVESTGGNVWTSSGFTALSGFAPGCLSNDGTLFGSREFIDGFTGQPYSIPMIALPGAPPVDYEPGTPMLVTENGQHVRIQSNSATELEVETRADGNAEWKKTGSKFTSTEQLFGVYGLRMGNGVLTLQYQSQIYILK